MKKKIVLLFVLLLGCGFTMAQSPQAFNYQAVARDAAGDVLQNQAVGIRLSLHKASASGVISYSETHLPTTNDFGLFTLTIGTGSIVTGQFDTLTWGSNQYWLQVEMDPNGGTSYTDMGTSQLLSVPYAMFAANAGSLEVPGTSGQTLRHDGNKWVSSSVLFNNGGRIGIGTTNPMNKLHVVNEFGGANIGLYTHNDMSNTGSAIDFCFSRGTLTTPGTILGGDAIGWLNFKGYDGTNYETSAWFMARASENWSATANGTDLMFVTTANGSTASTTRMVIMNDGKVGIGTSSPSTNLHVSGGARLTGAFYDGTNAAGSTGSVLTSTGTSTQWVNNSIGFSAYRSTSDVSLTAAAYNTIPFNSEYYDDGNGFNTTNGSYTIPAAGVYHFDACVRISGTATAGQPTVIGIFVNGIQQKHKRMLSETTSTSIDISADLKLLAGDVVRVDVYCQTATDALYTNNYSTFFTGHKVY